MAQFTREDFMRDAMERYSSAVKPDPKQDLITHD